MTKRKPLPQVFGGIALVTTVFDPIRDPEQALKEANASRLRDARIKQAMESSDPVVKHAILEQLKLDGSEISRLLPLALKGKRKDEVEREILLQVNTEKQHQANENRKLFLSIVEEVYAQKPHLKHATPHKLAGIVRKELERQGQKARIPSIRTIQRALAPKNKV